MAAGRGALSRRGLIAALGAAGAGGAGAAVLAGAGGDGAAARADVVPFGGEHQAGVATDVQAHLHFAAFDVLATDREELAGLLRDWTRAARSLTAGLPVGEGGAVGGDPLAPPEDTGEALGLPAARLTLTLGVGPSLFDDRFGLAPRRPEALVDLPPFPGDALDPARCGGDLAVQACADDPQVAVHAVRTLSRLAAGRAAVRWAQLGYGRAATVDPRAPTPRNLFGFKDGTANVAGRDTAALAEHVWVAAQDAAAPEHAWMTGGTYLVARRIAMHVETWDRSSLAEQERVVGRTKGEGAPLGGRREHEDVDPAALPATSHVRLAHPSRHGGARMLRRGFNYTDGATALGRLDAGLFFLAYQRDVRRAFVPVQRALAADDALNEYLRHTGSGVWAVPPGVGADGWWGQRLLA
ncbi:iron uptake transporter deferrochelatase/peroxidase subunit [Kineococcus terrestris]|uniref:iron uptake transporter deferrochelatase/peroxidase subunit n=1 Tax=Kineococcus terrestris TaxID=2044856 RepID=UPI0034DB6ECF